MALTLLLLPFSFFAIWVFINSWIKTDEWRWSFLLAFLSVNLYILFITEILSLFAVLNKLSVSLLWAVPLFVLGLFLLLPKTRKLIRLPIISTKPLTWLQIFLIALVGLILLVLGLVAFYAPPNTPDVLNYHLPRVMHWIQNQSVRHYATGIEFQNTYPPAAEYQILHLALLSGSDRWVNFAAWFTLVAAAVCVSFYSKLLKIGSTGQVLSALFLVTLPGAMLLAATAKNDLQVAFWVLFTLTCMTRYFNKSNDPLSLVAAFAGMGLGFLTKSNIGFFLIPVLIWFALAFLKKHGIATSVRWAFFAVVIFMAINAGFMLRNLQTYGSPLETYQSGRHLNEWITPRGILTNMIRNASFHLQTPWPKVREEIELFLLKVHVKLGIDINDPRTTNEGYFSILPLNTHENFSGSTLHAFLLIPMTGLYIYHAKKMKLGLCYWSPIIFSTAGFILYSAAVKWQIFGARYFLVFFFIAAPIFGAVLERIRSKVFHGLFALILIFSSWPWLLAAELRPLVSDTRFSNSPSILQAERIELLLGAPQEGFPGLMQLPETAQALDCYEIGIYGGGAATEYLVWAVLGAPFNQYRLGWIVAGSPSSAYIDPSFDPCLIICQDCPAEQETIRDFQRFFKGSRFDIYEPFNPPPD